MLKEANLRSAFELASVGVKNLVWSLFPDAGGEHWSALASAIVEVEVLFIIALSSAVAFAVADVPVEESGDFTDGFADLPCASADALANSVVEDEVNSAGCGGEDALAFGIIPSVFAGAWASKASASANIEGVVKVVSNWARLFLTDAFAAVPEGTAFTIAGFGKVGTVNFVPDAASRGDSSGKTDAFVTPVIVVFVSSAGKRLVSALAPGFLPVLSGSAGFGVALAVTLARVPVETSRAGMGLAEALATSFVPEVAWQTLGVLLDTTARAGVPSPVDVLTSVKCVCAESRVSVTIDWHALASTGPFVPVLYSGNAEVTVGKIFGIADLEWASAFASGLVPLLVGGKAVHGRDAHTFAVRFRPEGVLGAIVWRAYAGASVLVPDSACRAHRWAARAGAFFVVPNHLVWAVFGHAKALALRVIPELAIFAGCGGDADPSAILSAEVGMYRVGSSCLCLVTFAAASFSIKILICIAIACAHVSWITLAVAFFLVPVLVHIAYVTLLGTLAVTRGRVPGETRLALAR